MLAQNFKTAKDLGLSDHRFESLVKTLGVLERGEVKHVRIVDDLFEEGKEFAIPEKFDGLFNMDNTFTRANCGTAGCIAGTCDWLFKTDFAPEGNLALDLNFELLKLFCPNIDWYYWPKITVDQAARALRNYLSCGEARWKEIIGD